MSNKTLRILQNNIQSIRPNDTREDLFASLVLNEINAVLVQELWLREGEPFQLKNYKLVSKRRKEGYGGVGILLQEELQYEVLDIPDLGPVEAVGVRITGGFDPISLFSVYLPPNSRLTNEAKEGIENLFRDRKSVV